MASSLGYGVRVCGQTTSTGAVTGITLDPSSSILPGVFVELKAQDSPDKRSFISDENGWFGFLSLPPGTYQLQATKATFKPLTVPDMHVIVTETLRLNLDLEVTTHVEYTQVSSDPLMVQVDTSALGRVLNDRAVSDLPLVTRNFAQITGLSPGVLVGVYNAGELGTGATALSQIGQSNDGNLCPRSTVL